MSPEDVSARRRRGSTTAATALAVATASVAVLVAGVDIVVLLADEPPRPATAELAGTDPRGIGVGPLREGRAAPGPVPTAPEEPATATRAAPHALEAADPTAIVIPALDVDAAVMEVGLRDDGIMEVPPHAPRSTSRAGWFRHSPTPGELGPSVIVGHVDSDRHGPSVFHGLDSLTGGDRVEVRRADGGAAVFEVERVAQYDKDAFPTADVYGNIDHAGLRLISCGGRFDAASGAYEDNVVVYARLVTSHDLPTEDTGRGGGPA